jgi:hypothetical protein
MRFWNKGLIIPTRTLVVLASPSRHRWRLGVGDSKVHKMSVPCFSASMEMPGTTRQLVEGKSHAAAFLGVRDL